VDAVGNELLSGGENLDGRLFSSLVEQVKLALQERGARPLAQQALGGFTDTAGGSPDDREAMGLHGHGQIFVVAVDVNGDDIAADDSDSVVERIDRGPVNDE